MASTAPTAGHYSKPITEPATRKQGLLNFVQMIINRIEAGDTREALLTAVDLLDTLSGNANPFADVTDGLSRPALDAELRQQREEFAVARIAHGETMFAKGQDDMRRKLAALLGGAA